MVEPLNTKASGHDPKLIAALRSLKKKLEAMPEPLRGPFLVEGLAPYVSSPSLPVVDGGETAEKSEALAREYRPTMDKDIVHAWGADAAAALSEAATLITTQQQEIERLTKERDTALRIKDMSAKAIAWEKEFVRATTAESRVQTLEEEVKVLRDALKPFARIADMEEKAAPAASVMVNVNRCRDARAALSQGEKP